MQLIKRNTRVFLYSFLYLIIYKIIFFFSRWRKRINGKGVSGEFPRWWSMRTWSLSLPTNASRICLQMEQFSQNTYWTLAEDLKHLKGQEGSPYNWVGWKERNRKWDRTCIPGRQLKRRGEVPIPGETPSVGRSTGKQMKLQMRKWESKNWSVTGRTEWDLQRWSVLQPYAPQLEILNHWCQWGLNAGLWSLEHRTEERAVAGCMEMAWGGQECELVQWGVFMEEGWTTIETKCHCGVACKGQGCHCSLFSHVPAFASADSGGPSYLSGPKHSDPCLAPSCPSVPMHMGHCLTPFHLEYLTDYNYHLDSLLPKGSWAPWLPPWPPSASCSCVPVPSHLGRHVCFSNLRSRCW